jgi:hypothetical protein
MNDDEINNQQQQDDGEQKKPENYDVAGLLIGGGAGLFFGLTGVMDFLMSIIAGMFLGLVIGTFIKK